MGRRPILTDLPLHGCSLRWGSDALELLPLQNKIFREPSSILRRYSLVMVTPADERDLFPAFLYVYVDDAEEAYRRAVAAGATSLEEPLDTPYGDRRAMVCDPFGNVFQIVHRLAAAGS